jgi:hypothetical protein
VRSRREVRIFHEAVANRHVEHILAERSHADLPRRRDVRDGSVVTRDDLIVLSRVFHVVIVPSPYKRAAPKMPRTPAPASAVRFRSLTAGAP